MKQKWQIDNERRARSDEWFALAATIMFLTVVWLVAVTAIVMVGSAIAVVLRMIF